MRDLVLLAIMAVRHMHCRHPPTLRAAIIAERVLRLSKGPSLRVSSAAVSRNC